jgi:hypothetical protein
MKMTVVFTLFILTVFSCNKTAEETKPESVTDYFPMKIGSYWVYQHYRVDLNGNSTKLPLVDSIVVANDTTINDKKYFVFEGTDYFRKGKNWSILGIFRDSSNCIVNQNGEVKFSLANFTDTLREAVLTYDSREYAQIIYKMIPSDIHVSVPAGKFKALNFRGTFMANTDFIPSSIENPRYLNNFYSKGVGLVAKNYFYFTGENTFEVKLARYNIHNAPA